MSEIQTQFVTRSKHTLAIKIDMLLLYREILAVFSEIHSKYKNALWSEQRISEC